MVELATRPRRSALYLPASNARALEKARGLASDVVILDLEDAVAPEMKVAARQAAVAAIAEGRSEEHTSELQSLMRISYAVFCLKKKHDIMSVDQQQRTKAVRENTPQQLIHNSQTNL